MRTRLIALLVPLLVLAMGVVGTAAAAPGNGGERTDVIVVLHDGEDARDAARDAARDHNADVSFVYEHALQGFAASVPEGRLHALERDARVDYVELDRPVSIQAQTTPTGIQRIFADDNAEITINGSDDWRVNVDVAVVDTGIDLEHPDLNVERSVDCTVSSGGGPPWARDYYCSDTEGTGGDDDHYHGTHVAGTIGAIDNGTGVVGVAPGARLHAVKVLDSSGSGYTSGIVAGINQVIEWGDIEVLNMSLGGSGSCTEGSAYDDAIDSAVGSGIAVAVAAGNSGADAKDYSPASCDNAFTVSALADFDGEPGGLFEGDGCRTDQDDTFADFSNWGSAVDVIAPGVCILSTYPIEQGSYGTISGTSMAAPHVAGALALLASTTPNNADKGGGAVATLYSDVKGAGNFEWDNSDDGDNDQEPLLDVRDVNVFAPTLVPGGGDDGTTNSPPTANFSSSCTDLTCDFTDTSTDDGTITSWSWDFGDGATSTAQHPSHTYAGGNTYTVTLTVTDDGGKTDSAQQDVTVSEPPATGDFALDTTGYKVKGRHHVDLSWDGATSPDVDVYRNGTLLTTTANDGAYTDATNNVGGASYTYQVCEAGTSTCSNEQTVVF